MKKLSNREKDVLKLICFDNNEIAERLFISIATVKIHLVNIFTKLNCYNRTQALIVALKNNIITLEQVVLPDEVNYVK